MVRGGGSTRTRPARSAERPPRQIFPIAVKYGAVSGLILVAFVLWVGSTSTDLALKSSARQVNSNGNELVLLVSSMIHPFWQDDSLSMAEQSLAQEQLSDQLSDFIKAPGEHKVLDILVLNQTGRNLIANARGGDRLSYQLGQPKTLEGSKVRVRSGTLSVGAVQSPVRSFETNLPDDAGQVHLFLNAEAIEQLESSLESATSSQMWTVLLLGIPFVLLVGFLLTRPIRRLREDMTLVARGDLQHQSTVSTTDELGALASSFNRMTRFLAEAREQELHAQAVARDLSIATRIQNALLPEELPEISGIEMACYYQPAREVGGDYYDVISLPGGRAGIVVADVSGKGLAGSLVMTMTRSLVRMAARTQLDAASILEEVNASLSRDMTEGMFVTLAWAELDDERSQVRIARAGHNPPLLLRASGRVEQFQPGGISLGMDPGPLFSQSLEVSHVDLAPGDSLILYTDGIVEAMNHDGVEYGLERFAQILQNLTAAAPEEVVEGVVTDLARHVAGAEASDDITLVVARRELES